MSVWKPILHFYQHITNSTSLFMLFFPLPIYHLNLFQRVFVGKHQRHDVLKEFPFQTALHGMKFCASLAFNICCCSGVKFLTNSTNLNFCSFASDSMKSLLSWRFWSTFQICWLYICRALFLSSLIAGLWIKGSEATVTLLLIFTSTESLITFYFCW